MILPDYPISKTEQDKLRRSPLAKKISDTINTFDRNGQKWAEMGSVTINFLITSEEEALDQSEENGIP